MTAVCWRSAVSGAGAAPRARRAAGALLLLLLLLARRCSIDTVAAPPARFAAAT